jgi:hypothetical protein
LISESNEKFSLLLSFLALAVYPAAIFLAFSLNPVEFFWGSSLARRGLPPGPMPPDMQDKADSVTRRLNFLVDALIVSFVCILFHRTGSDVASIGFNTNHWMRDLSIGITVGVSFLVTVGLMLQKVPIDSGHAFTSRVRKGSPLLWVFILSSGAFSEELWIAFCLVVLKADAHSAAASAAVIVCVFATGHYSYGLWGVVAVAAKGAVSALLFLHFRSLFATFPYHLVTNLGSLYWNRYWRR